MRRNMVGKLAVVILLAAAWALAPAIAADAPEMLKYSCSNQVFQAFEKENCPAFTEATGIKLDVRKSSSGSALYRLMNGYSDVASTARALDRRHMDYGFDQIPFARDPIAVIVKKDCGVDNLTEPQLQGIFGKTIQNWKEVGGNDLPIIVIVPGEDTAANKNFRRLVMRENEIDYDFMTYESTMAIDAVKYFPCGSISFISMGAAKHFGDEVSTLKINGHSPQEEGYPYYQTFYYVTKGVPSGDAKKFIDFARSSKGAEMIRKNGMVPISK